MLRLFRRSARLLFAAGVLGVVCSPPWLLAQTAAGGLSSIQVSTSQLRLEAMKVEMALLADSQTFQLPLAVQVTPSGLELRGRIGDERLREHALRIARQACYLPVLDSIDASIPRTSAYPINPTSMKRTVLDVLTATMGERLHNLEVLVSPQGEITLTGFTPSVEDKLAASKALRNLPGCLAIFNSLSVQAFQQAGHTVTLVTRDGQLAVHGVLPATTTAAASVKPIEPTCQVVAVDARPATPHIPLPPAPTPTIPSGLPPAREVYVRMRSVNQVNPVVYVAPPSGYANASGPMAVSVVSPPLPASSPTKGSGGLLDRFIQTRQSAERVQAPANAVVVTTPAATAVPVAPRPAPATASAPTTSPAKNWHVGYPGGAPSAATERPAIMTHASAIRQAAQPQWKQPAPSQVEPPPVTPVAVLPATPPSRPEPTPPPVPAITPTAAQSAPLPPIAEPGETPALTPVRIESLVWTACGKQVKSVKVVASPDGRHTVHIYPVAGMDQEVLNKVTGVPEILTSQLRLQIHLSH